MQLLKQQIRLLQQQRNVVSTMEMLWICGWISVPVSAKAPGLLIQTLFYRECGSSSTLSLFMHCVGRCTSELAIFHRMPSSWRPNH